MSTYRWLSLGVFCGITFVVLSVGVRADEEEATADSQQEQATIASDEKAIAERRVAEEKSVLVAQEPQKPGEGEHDFCHCVGEANSAVVTRIEEALRGPLRSKGLSFSETPLSTVAKAISEEYDFPIQLDEGALEEIGLSADEPMTINIQGVSLRSALQLMLERIDATYIVRHEVLLITTEEEAERHLVTCVYDVEALIDEGNAESMDSLIDSIVTCVATETWAENGGGEAEVRPLKPGLLVVSQTHAIQEEVAGLLEAIRTMREQVPFTPSHAREPEPAEQK